MCTPLVCEFSVACTATSDYKTVNIGKLSCCLRWLNPFHLFMEMSECPYVSGFKMCFEETPASTGVRFQVVIVTRCCSSLSMVLQIDSAHPSEFPDGSGGDKIFQIRIYYNQIVIKNDFISIYMTWHSTQQSDTAEEMLIASWSEGTQRMLGNQIQSRIERRKRSY